MAYSQAEIDFLVQQLNSGEKTVEQLAAQYGVPATEIQANLDYINTQNNYTPPAETYTPPAEVYTPPVYTPPEPAYTPPTSFGDPIPYNGMFDTVNEDIAVINSQGDFNPYDGLPSATEAGGYANTTLGSDEGVYVGGQGTGAPYVPVDIPDDTEGVNEGTDILQSQIGDAIHQIQNSGMSGPEQVEATAELLRNSGLSGHAVAQTLGVPVDQIEFALASGGFDISGNTTQSPTNTDPAIDGQGNPMPVDLNTIDPNDYTDEQLDSIIGAINDGSLSIEDVAGHYGVDPSVISANMEVLNGQAGGADGGGADGGGADGGGTVTGGGVPGGGGTVAPTYNAPTYNAPTYNSGGDSDHTIRNQAVPPDYLQPFLNESVNYSRGALGALGDVLSKPNALISPFNDVQRESQDMAAAFARDPNGALSQSQNVLNEISDGSDIEALFGRGQNLMENGAGRSQLTQFSNTGAGNQTGIDALESSAAGNNLYGTPAFDNAVQASMRAAQPMIASTFSKAGSGGLKSGLAQIGMQQAASDAFSRLYGQERSNQLNSANSLNSLSLGNRGMQQNAAGQLLGADQQAGNTQLQMANSDRSRQMSAAQLLPQYGLMNSDILGSVGGQQQNQDTMQRQLGVDQYQKLMEYSFGDFNPTALMGQSSSQPVYQNRGSGLLGGAITGAQSGANIGNVFGKEKWGAAIGGIAGGLLGGGYF